MLVGFVALMVPSAVQLYVPLGWRGVVGVLVPSWYQSHVVGVPLASTKSRMVFPYRFPPLYGSVCCLSCHAVLLAWPLGVMLVHPFPGAVGAASTWSVAVNLSALVPMFLAPSVFTYQYSVFLAKPPPAVLQA